MSTIYIILENERGEPTESLSTPYNSAYFCGCNSDIFPLMSEVSDVDYNVFAATDSAPLVLELSQIAQDLQGAEHEHALEVIRLVEACGNAIGWTVTFTPWPDQPHALSDRDSPRAVMDSSMDNATFFVANAALVDVRDCIAKICSLDAETILLATTSGYTWLEPDAYVGRTLLQWHAYQNGDLLLEIFVLLGGRHLGISPQAEPGFFRNLAARLRTQVVFYDPNGSAFSTDCGAPVIPVRLDEPEEYGDDGPTVTGT